MTIDETIRRLIDDGLLDPEVLHTGLTQLMEVVERLALERAISAAMVDGFAEATVRLAIKQGAEKLREARAQRLAGVHVVLDRELAREALH